MNDLSDLSLKQTVFDFEHGNPHETVRLSPEDETSNGESGALPSVVLSGMGALFALNAKIGQGGMGEVHRAMQVGLERDVAIKRTRAGRHADSAKDSLLREARAMGHLEHPNIVPVHVIALDEQGQPFVAMKYIHGQTLADRLEKGVGAKNLEEFVDALVSVCHALNFAHSKGILHLDIKPANIMLGEYGEVYLLDWGSAANFGEAGLSGLPNIRDQKKILGTPCYIAPELVSNEESVGPGADIYLMGGMLYAALCGSPPHIGESSTEAMVSSYSGRVKPLPLQTDPILRAICLKALSRYAVDRYRSAEELRLALLQWRESRAANVLLGAAQVRLKELVKLIKEGAAPPEVYRAFGAARSGFEYAVDAFPVSANYGAHGKQDSIAIEGLFRTISLLIRYELELKNPAGAMRLYEDLPIADEGLLSEITEALKVQEELVRDAEEFKQLRHDLDPLTASRQKAWVWFGIGLAIALPQLVPQFFGHVPDALSMATSHMALLVVVAILFGVLRKRLFATRANRSLTMAIGVLVVFAMVVRMGAVLGASSLAYALALDLALVATLSLYAIWNIDRRIRFVVPGYILGAIGCGVFQEYATYIFPMVHLINMSILSAYFGLKKQS